MADWLGLHLYTYTPNIALCCVLRYQARLPPCNAGCAAVRLGCDTGAKLVLAGTGWYWLVSLIVRFMMPLIGASFGIIKIAIAQS